MAGAKGRKLSRHFTKPFNFLFCIRQARIAEDAALTQRPRPEFRPALEPADQLTGAEPFNRFIQIVAIPPCRDIGYFCQGMAYLLRRIGPPQRIPFPNGWVDVSLSAP